MAYTTIDKPSDYFETKLYTGNGGTQSITGLDFQPDWLWIKARTYAYYHYLQDSVRGADRTLFSNETSSEQTYTAAIQSFDSNGFTTGSQAATNYSGRTFVSWNWKAGGTASSNTDGSITSSVSANQDAGFSIVSYTGNGSSAQTVGHGLNSAPEIIITKNRIDAVAWQVGSDYLTSWSYYVRLNTTDAQSSTGGGQVYGTAPTSTVFTVGNDNAVNGSSDGIISYCFHSVKGFSKIGKYTGNGSTNGTFVYTGFKPAWVMIKRSDTANDWLMFDNKRNPYNFLGKYLLADTSSVEAGGTTDFLDFVSNGFKLNRSGSDVNASGGTYIYMAFAENPFVTSTGVPATAR